MAEYDVFYECKRSAAIRTSRTSKNPGRRFWCCARLKVELGLSELKKFVFLELRELAFLLPKVPLDYMVEL
uniref:Uncharacterized protein n=1 Tax=Daucus carota subsp. sativus TaxID=79200 RepID=A0A161ZLZ6_DAUCS